MQVFELVMSRLLFWVSTDDQLLSPFQKVLGEIPGHWIAEALEKGFLTKSQFEGIYCPRKSFLLF